MTKQSLATSAPNLPKQTLMRMVLCLFFWRAARKLCEMLSIVSVGASKQWLMQMAKLHCEEQWLNATI